MPRPFAATAILTAVAAILVLQAGLPALGSAWGAAAGPQFVSLKSNEVNMRAGPGTRYPVQWVYRRRGLPLELLTRFENWRKVRDLDGTVGWVHRSLLSTRRTAMVIGSPQPLRADAAPSSGLVARVEPGVIAMIRECPGHAAACRVTIGPHEGWLDRAALWGLAPREAIE